MSIVRGYRLLLTGIISLLLIVGGYLYYSFEAQSIRQKQFETLSSIAALKTSQITQWIKERVSDADMLTRSPFFIHIIEEWLADRQNANLENQILQRFSPEVTGHFYEKIFLISAKGETLLPADTEIHPANPVLTDKAAEVAIEQKVSFTDFYFCPLCGRIHYDILAPVINDKKMTIALVVFRINPEDFLYPLISSWPVPSKTAETLLLRKDGDSALFLNELKHRKNTALKFRIPLTRKEVPAVAAVWGKTGIFEGIDYRGVPVLSDISAIPETPWYMVSKVDKSEIYAELYYRGAITGIFVIVLIGLLCLGLSLFYSLRQKNIYQELFIKEKKLREVREEFRTTLYSIGDGVITTDHAGAVKNLNPEAEKMTGWSEAEAKGKPLNQVFNIINEETRRPVENPVEKVLAEGLVVGLANHTLLVSKDGMETPIADSGAPIPDDSGKITGVVLVFQDQTAQRNAQKKIEQSEALLRTQFQNSPDRILILDRQYRFITLNRPIHAQYGVDEMVGKDILQFIPEHERTFVKSKIDECFASKAIQEFEHDFDRNHWASARIVPLPSDGQIDRVMIISTDITRRKLAEQAFMAERERLDITLRSIADGVITTDVEGKVVMLNAAASELTGWSSEEAEGRPLPEVFNIIHEITRNPCENPVEKVLANGTPIELANHTCLISKNGNQIIIADSAAPIRDSGSRILGVVLVFRDMTEKQKLVDSMQREQKLESLGVLAGGIAHDFNNLLGGVFGFIDLAQIHLSSDNIPEARKKLSDSLESLEQAKALTNQLLTFAKGGAPALKTVHLEPLIKNCCSLSLSGSNVGCQFEIASDLKACICDKNQISQAINNIVINAKQAMPFGGTISIKARNEGQNSVRISIEDHGIGIPKSIINHIFDPFFTTKETGHGLGLSTVFSILKRHNGKIDVESEPGKGSVFHLCLPASHEDQSEGSAGTSALVKGSGRVLVMDDEKYMRDLYLDMLQLMGFSVVTSINGLEALDLFREAEDDKKPFDLIILDLTIKGGMGGVETLKEIRKMAPQAVIVAASGYANDPVMSNPVEHGFTCSLFKPFNLKELSDLLKQIAGKKE